MAWFDKGKATTSIVAKNAKKVANEVKKEIDNEFGDSEWYQEAKNIATEVKKEAQIAYQVAAELSGVMAEDFGNTESGKFIGEKSRSAGKFLSTLPIFSLKTDVIKNRHGVEHLFEHFSEDPNDPERALFLAEALSRVQSDLDVYSKVRSATSPTYAVISKSLITASYLGKEPSDPTQIKLLKLAFFKSIEKLKANPADSKALHILSRVYLAQKKHGEAIRFGKLSILADPNDGLPWVTLSRTYSEIDQHENARRAANRAIEKGAKYGYLLIADYDLADSEKANFGQVTKYIENREKVSLKDRSKYLGPGVLGNNILEGIGRNQFNKLTELFS